MPFAAPEMISQSITQKTISWINHHNQADAETNKATAAFIGKTDKSCVWNAFKSFFRLNVFFNTNPFFAKSTFNYKVNQLSSWCILMRKYPVHIKILH
jgi:hypothetical protein